MKFAVMQPYIFPYLGYYQLVNSVDKFVFYDDVTFIKGGYINRNNILSNGVAQRFTIPVPGMSSNILINKLSFDKNIIKTLKAIQQNYSKSPYFKEVYPFVESVFLNDDRGVASICRLSIEYVFTYLGIEKEFFNSSQLDYDREQTAADKLISIARLMKCENYVNSPGGKNLYSKAYFKKNDIDLSFIEMKVVEYCQGNNKEFMPYLSMIDVLMWNNKDKVKSLLEACSFN